MIQDHFNKKKHALSFIRTTSINTIKHTDTEHEHITGPLQFKNKQETYKKHDTLSEKEYIKSSFFHRKELLSLCMHTNHP